MNKNQERVESLLKNLPQTADESLSGLTAGPHLKARIERAAASPAPMNRIRFSMPRWAPAVVCCALVLVIALAALPMLKDSADSPAPLTIDTYSLGDPTPIPVVPDNANFIADLDNASFSISASSSAPGYRSLWTKSTGGSFPLIGLSGKYYRMLTSPYSVDSALLGKTVGTVSEFTTEPSLSGTDAVLSNIAPIGTKVYAIGKMGDSLVAADIDGRIRLFQRVSFNGNALRGKETLADTLAIAGHVIAMELSDVGTITDPATCEMLLEILLDNASYESSGSVSSKQSLLMELDNGLVLQLAVKGDNLAACGVWSCPEFLEAFEDACN